METRRNSFGLQRHQWIFASALMGAATMLIMLIAAIAGAPESAFIGICLGGLSAMFAAAYIGHQCR